MLYNKLSIVFIKPPQTMFGGGGYAGITLSVHPPVRVSQNLVGHNFKSIKATKFKLHTQIGHIMEKCSVQEP